MPKTDCTQQQLYPVVLHYEEEVWGYFVPEFGGGGADSREAALRSAQELIELGVAELVERGEVVSPPEQPDQLSADGGQIVWLPVDVMRSAL